MWRVASRVIAAAVIVSPLSTVLAQTGVDAPDVARRHAEFTIEFDAGREFSLTGVFGLGNDQTLIVESAEVHIGEQTVELEVVPPSMYVGLAPTQVSLETPFAAFEVYALSDDLLVIIGDSTFAAKDGPFEPFFAALQPENNSVGSWSSEVSLGLWGTAILFDLLMPDLEPKPEGAIPAEDVLPQYTCEIEIEDDDTPYRLPGVLPNGKRVFYLLILTKSGEIEAVVVCIDETTGVGQLALCETPLPLVGSGNPPGVTPTVAADIFQLLSDSTLTVP